MESAELTRLLGLLNSQSVPNGNYGQGRSGSSSLPGLSALLPMLRGGAAGNPGASLAGGLAGGLGGLAQLAPLLQGLGTANRKPARPAAAPDLDTESGPVIDVEVKEAAASTAAETAADSAAGAADAADAAAPSGSAAEAAADAAPSGSAAETADAGAGHRSSASARRTKRHPPRLDPQAMLGLLEGLEQLNSLRSRPDPPPPPPQQQPPPPPPPQPSAAAEDDFDPCQLCDCPCLRRQAARLSFEQARQLAAAFPPYI